MTQTDHTILNLNSIPHTDSDIFCNEGGYVRLSKVQKEMGLLSINIGSYIDDQNFIRFKTKRKMVHSLSDSKLDLITQLCIKWRDQREVLPVLYTFAEQSETFIENAKLDRNTAAIIADAPTNGPVTFKNKLGLPCSHYKGVVFDWEYKEHSEFKVTPKRGNAVYVDIVKRRLQPLLQSKPTFFFDPASRGLKRTKMLSIVLNSAHAFCRSCSAPIEENNRTCTRCGSHDIELLSVADAWLDFGKKFNKFITNLRNQFSEPIIIFNEAWISEKNPKGIRFSILGDGIVYIRAWQAQGNYYPHVHMVAYFSDQEFTAVRWVDQSGPHKGEISFRLAARSNVRKAIKHAWRWGFCDIKCICDTQTAYKDLLKYVLRDLEGGESDLTNGMVWFFEKRSFSISGEYFKIGWREPDDFDLINTHSDNSNSLWIRCDIFPIMGQDLAPKIWQSTLINKDPPTERENSCAYLKNNLVPYECKPSPDIKAKNPYLKCYLWRNPPEVKT